MTPEEIGRRLLGPALVTRLERHLAPPLTADLCRLVAAVAAQERAACAALAEAEASEWDPEKKAGVVCEAIADAIRARGAAT